MINSENFEKVRDEGKLPWVTWRKEVGSNSILR